MFYKLKILLFRLKKAYNSMSNRALAIIILIVVFFFLWNFLVKKTIENKQIETKKIEKVLQKKGENKIKKEENIFLEKKEKEIIKKITKKEKREKLIRRLKGEKAINIFLNDKIYSKKNGNKIFIFINKKEILNFENVNISENLENYNNINKKEKSLNKGKEIYFDKIYSKNKEIYIFFENQLFLYNLTTKKLIKIDFGIIPNYIKKISGKKYLIVTKKGSFIYDSSTKILEFFYLFKDFIVYKNNYIGIIYANEKNKKKNLGLEKYSSNIIINYDLKTKNKKIILENVFNFEKIIEENNEIYIFFDNEKYLLKEK